MFSKENRVLQLLQKNALFSLPPLKMAKRYDQKTKDEVVSFIQAFNQENGRGGQSAAAKKWKLNPITVKAWLEKAGVASPGKSAKKKRGDGLVVSSKSLKTNGSAKNAEDVLNRLMVIQKEISSLQREYDSLKSKL
ncbi:hypothetical protein VSU19_04135 [Verrucomicrobiales bacterium BCK34]|nr:hypothetical protein [Verrucomicrobiales bacterium BCK34]